MSWTSNYAILGDGDAVYHDGHTSTPQAPRAAADSSDCRHQSILCYSFYPRTPYVYCVLAKLQICTSHRIRPGAYRAVNPQWRSGSAPLLTSMANDLSQSTRFPEAMIDCRARLRSFTNIWSGNEVVECHCSHDIVVLRAQNWYGNVS